MLCRTFTSGCPIRGGLSHRDCNGRHSGADTLAPGKYADLAVLSADYMRVPPEEIRRINSVLTVVGGRIVHGEGDYVDLAPPPPPASPSWSPISAEPSPAMRAEAAGGAVQFARACHDGCANDCTLHGHDHQIAGTIRSRSPTGGPSGARWAAPALRSKRIDTTLARRERRHDQRTNPTDASAFHGGARQ